MPTETDRLETDELQVKRHVKMQSPLGRLDVHASANALGVWMKPAGMKGSNGQFGCFIQGGNVCLAWYPTEGAKLPNAITTVGVQLVKADGTPMIIPFTKLAELAELVLGDAKPKESVHIRTADPELQQRVRDAIAQESTPEAMAANREQANQQQKIQPNEMKVQMDVRPVADPVLRASNVKNVTLSINKLYPGQLKRLREFVAELTQSGVQSTEIDRPYMG